MGSQDGTALVIHRRGDVEDMQNRCDRDEQAGQREVASGTYPDLVRVNLVLAASGCTRVKQDEVGHTSAQSQTQTRKDRAQTGRASHRG